ncbi:MAG: hypothetical protein F4X57_13930 [Chloroflexi bacterium]|nr:hypothetical protein [Chloroflexota bacterium]
MQEEKLNLRRAMDQPKFQLARRHLRDYRDRVDTSLSQEYWQSLSPLKREAVNGGDQLTAKAVWCLETIGRIQDHFVTAFNQIMSGECEEAWQQLERCEIEISFLDRHFSERPGEFGVEHARIHTKKCQELYLLNWGFSPAFLCKDIRCSICNAKITLRSECGHELGEIHDGEMCGRVVKDFELLHIALVEKPVQKYSVFFPDGNDDDRLAPIKFLGRNLISPWHRWSYYKEVRRQHHPVFRNVRRNDPCPCDSGRKYKRCCLGNEELFPHFQFSFEEHTANEMSPLEVIRPRRSQITFR